MSNTVNIGDHFPEGEISDEHYDEAIKIQKMICKLETETGIRRYEVLAASDEEVWQRMKRRYEGIFGDTTSDDYLSTQVGKVLNSRKRTIRRLKTHLNIERSVNEWLENCRKSEEEAAQRRAKETHCKFCNQRLPGK